MIFSGDCDPCERLLFVCVFFFSDAGKYDSRKSFWLPGANNDLLRVKYTILRPEWRGLPDKEEGTS
jgi:hypothetical protein